LLFTREPILTERTRWFVLALLSASMAINLVDRQVLSVLAPVIRDQLRLSNTGYSYIVCAFQCGMLLGQAPMGAFIDRVGTRRGLALIFAAWSLINAAHALAASLAVFVGLRFLMGLSECGNYSGGIKAIVGLFPAERRSSAGGIFNAGAQLGAVLSPPLIVLISQKLNWQMGFVLPSLLGLIWIVPWLSVAPEDRDDRARVGDSTPQVPFAALIRNRKVAGLILLRIFTGPLVSFYWYWLPEYLRSGRKMSFVTIGLLAWLPYLFGCLGNIAGGWVSDKLVRLGNSVDQARKIGFTLSLGLSALSMTLPLVHSDALAIAVICVVVFGNQWVAAHYIASVGDMFPPSIVGRVNGLAGAGDSASALLAMLLTGIVVDHFSYTPVFIAAGILTLLAIAGVFVVLQRIEPAQIV
jgi:ACS family hexuronate transporter-like MFS transporter